MTSSATSKWSMLRSLETNRMCQRARNTTLDWAAEGLLLPSPYIDPHLAHVLLIFRVGAVICVSGTESHRQGCIVGVARAYFPRGREAAEVDEKSLDGSHFVT
jgi:hypothetical protein